MLLRAAKLGSEKAAPDLEFRIGAAMLYKGRVIISWNRQRTSPQAKKWYKYVESGKQWHAEYGLFDRIMLDDLPIKSTIWVWRTWATNKNKTGMARPCLACRKMLKENGIIKVIYTIPGNMYEEEKL